LVTSSEVKKSQVTGQGHSVIECATGVGLQVDMTAWVSVVCASLAVNVSPAIPLRATLDTMSMCRVSDTLVLGFCSFLQKIIKTIYI